MEFFDLTGIPQIFLEFFFPATGSLEEYISLSRLYNYICMGVAGGLYLILLILGGIGLSTMARRAGVKHGWISFLPFGNTYMAGKLAGETNFFGQKIKRAGLYAMIAEIVYVVMQVMVTVINFMLMQPEYYQEISYTDRTGALINDYSFSVNAVPENLRWLVDFNTYGSIVVYLLMFLVLVFFCIVFMALFRKYYARSPFLMTFLCTILPFRGITLFAVRNNTPVQYEEYMRKRAEEYARRMNPYGPYGPGTGGSSWNGGANNANTGSSAPSGDPFNEFPGSDTSDGSGTDSSGGNDSPFDDFS